MISSWTALPDLVPRAGPGMVFDWQQQTGMLTTSGDVGIIRVWNIERELAIQVLPLRFLFFRCFLSSLAWATQDMATGSDCCVTSMLSHMGQASILVAACGDGTIRLFDCRVPTRYSPVVVLHEHKDWVVNIGITALDHQIVSGSLSGEVKFWDVRKNVSFKVLDHVMTLAIENGILRVASS